jgi:hypothetical protein
MLGATAKAWFAIAAFTIPVAACSSGTTTGAAGGAVTGAVIGGPVGAAVGGVAGAAAGAALTANETTRVHQYVVTQRRPSARISEEVVVGTALPPRVRLYPVPPQVGLTTRYDYAVVNNRTVLVDPASRQVTYIIE